MNAVEKIQVILNDAGATPPLKVDGHWGPRSQAALNWLVTGSPKIDGRTDWRGFVEVNQTKLKKYLPPPADKLVPSFMEHAKTFDLNPLFLIAISQHETGSWTSPVFKTKNNAMGISGTHGPLTMPSYDESIRRMARSLSSSTGYYAECDTLDDVAKVYAPVGAENDPTHVNHYWPDSVSRFWEKLEEAVV